MRRLAIAVVLLTAGCSLHRSTTTTASLAPTPSTIDRMTVRTAEQAVVVDSPTVAGRRVERIIQETGGYLEQSSGSKDGKVRIVGRVPAAQLDSIMNVVAGLGQERRRSTTGVDVTDQYTDLEARLRSNIALRDRLQQLLARAATLDEVLTLEHQIARIQTDIDGLQAHIDQLKSQATLASLSVNFDRKRVLGPLAIVGNGLAWAVGKLFIIH
jgi:Domain of unknown function (DUF4349)